MLILANVTQIALAINSLGLLGKSMNDQFMFSAH